MLNDKFDEMNVIYSIYIYIYNDKTIDSKQYNGTKSINNTLLVIKVTIFDNQCIKYVMIQMLI